MDCFILKSGHETADVCKTIESLKPIASNFKGVDDLNQINYEDKQSDWYCVFYDNEAIGESLCDAIPMFLEYAQEDCLVLIKYVGKESFIKCPKIYRRDVRLKYDSLLPEDEYTFLTVLDGYVWRHDQDRV
jgi:hypothetical protein